MNEFAFRYEMKMALRLLRFYLLLHHDLIIDYSGQAIPRTRRPSQEGGPTYTAVIRLVHRQRKRRTRRRLSTIASRALYGKGVNAGSCAWISASATAAA